jgi:hypothetical protein
LNVLKQINFGPWMSQKEFFCPAMRFGLCTPALDKWNIMTFSLKI